MISNKHIFKIAIGLIITVLLFITVVMIFPDRFINEKNYSEYEEVLFNDEKIITIDISIDEDEWQGLLNNAIKEEYYQCDVEINGEVLGNVGIRAKGNTSLSSIANDPDNNRYSFKLEFDHFVDGQSLYGLDKLALNNGYADITNMKEAIIYDMYSFLDADAPLYNYAEIYVNGEYWGVYLALESVEDSFMLRNYGTENGYLYKPDGMNMGNHDKENALQENKMPNPGAGMNFKERDFNSEDFSPENFSTPPELITPEEGSMLKNFTPDDKMPAPGGEIPTEEEGKNRFVGGKGGFGGMGGKGGGNLNYTDDSLSSYYTIWDGAINDSTDADHKRVVEALKNISNGNNVENYLDIENIVKYMSVHSFSVNDDSLSGNMAHNYYLYESDGKLNIIPWDYNLAFGGMGGGDVVNDAIDDSYSSTEFFDAILENDELKALYHECYERLIDEYIYSGQFDYTYNRIKNLTDHLVKTDPTFMYSYEEYEKACDMLYRIIMLRAESVKGQLSGSIPSTSEGQRQDSSKLIDTSSVDTSVTGSMRGGRGEKADFADRNKNDIPGEERKEQNGKFQRMSGNFTPVTANPVKNILFYSVLVLLIAGAFIFVKFFRRYR